MTEKEVKALFYIEPKTERNHAQGIGLRMLLTEKMIHAGFKKGGVINLPDRRVEVVLEGKQEDIEKFHNATREHLMQWLEASMTNKEKLMKMVGNPGIQISNLEFKEGILVLDIGLYSHSLELGQLHKGVDVYYMVTEAINTNTRASNKLIELVETRLSK